MAMQFLGDYPTDQTIYVYFNTFDSNDPSASVTITGFAVTDIEIYKDGSATTRASDAGYTLLDTDGIDFAGHTGIHGFSVDTSDNTDAGFFAAGSDYTIIVASVTVDGATVNFVAATFSIDNRGLLRPTVAARTLDVTATGAAGIDWANVENPTTAVDLSATDIQLADTTTTNTDMVAEAPTAAANATAVWDRDATSNQTAGTFGQAIGDPGVNAETMYDAVVTDATDINVATDVVAMKAETVLIVADTGELQTDWVNGGRLDLILDARAAQTTADAIETDTQNIQSRIPDALVAGSIKSDMLAISGDTAAADNLEESATGVITTSVNDAAASTTVFITALTEATDDHYNGRIIVFTSGTLLGQATDITDYTGASKTVTVTALTEPPADSVTFVIV